VSEKASDTCDQRRVLTMPEEASDICDQIRVLSIYLGNVSEEGFDTREEGLHDISRRAQSKCVRGGL